MTKRARDDLEAQYAIERALAQRLREAPGSERARLYGELYDELFRRVPNHPQIQKDPAERNREVGERLEFMARFLRPDATLMELGAGDCAFSVRAAALVRQVLAVDVSSVIAEVDSPCENLTVVLSDGTSVPVAEGSVDVAYSDQLMEHLHPDDAIAQLANIHRALRPGAPYVCITPNRCTGPHDVSRIFDEVASGFHLHEYSARELSAHLRAAGFSRLRYYAGGAGHYVRVPERALTFAEDALWRLPKRVRHLVREWRVTTALFGLTVVASG